jgi:CheY-like chemotaxis protein
LLIFKVTFLQGDFSTMTNRFVLVADTNDVFVDSLREELSSTAYVLLHAKNGQEALYYFESLEPYIDIVIMNLELSHVTGAMRIIPTPKQPAPPGIIWTRASDVPSLKPFGANVVPRIPIPMQEWRTAIATVLTGSSNRVPKASLLAIPAGSKITSFGSRRTPAPTEAM